MGRFIKKLIKMDATNMGFFPSFLSSSLASSFAEICTIPIDTAKVRLVLSRQISIQTGKPSEYTNLFQTLFKILKEEKFLNLYKGTVAGFHRQIVFGGLRFTLYQPTRNFLADIMHEEKNNTGLLNKILSAALSGTAAITVANPTDLIKNRLQGNKEKIYSSTFNA